MFPTTERDVSHHKPTCLIFSVIICTEPVAANPHACIQSTDFPRILTQIWVPHGSSEKVYRLHRWWMCLSGSHLLHGKQPERCKDMSAIIIWPPKHSISTLCWCTPDSRAIDLICPNHLKLYTPGYAVQLCYFTTVISKSCLYRFFVSHHLNIVK